MNLKLLFRIYAGLQIVFVLGSIFSPEAMMDSFGMKYSAELTTMMQFAMLGQVIIIAITLQLPNWLGDNLSKAALAYVGFSVLPILLNVYHIATEVLPMTTAFYIENTMWAAFAVLFYIYSKK